MHGAPLLLWAAVLGPPLIHNFDTHSATRSSFTHSLTRSIGSRLRALPKRGASRGIFGLKEPRSLVPAAHAADLSGLAERIGFEPRVWVIWFGNPMSGARWRAAAALERQLGLNITLVTDTNVGKFLKPGHPLHPAWDYLSAIHKSDYLAAYLAHHWGGGYHDVKPPHGPWADHFSRFANRSLWLFGPREQQAGHVACKEVVAADDPSCLALRASRGESATFWRPTRPEASYELAYNNGTLDPYDSNEGVCCDRVRGSFRSLVTVQAFIARPGTPLTREWLAADEQRLDHKLERLRAHPARFPRCCHRHEDGYPIGWNDLKGGALHPLQCKHAAHVDTSMPRHPMGAAYRDPASEDRRTGS